MKEHSAGAWEWTKADPDLGTNVVDGLYKYYVESMPQETAFEVDTRHNV